VPRPRNAIPRERINLHLPEDVRGRLDLHLVSESTQKVPQGAYQRFFTERVHEYFEWGSIDLAAYISTLPHRSIIRGPRPLIELIREYFKVVK
jgi:hypothetical protein